MTFETTGQIPGMGNGMAFPSMFPFAGGTQVGFCPLHIFEISLSCLVFLFEAFSDQLIGFPSNLSALAFL